MNPDLKIAVLISGEYRTFDICRPTMSFLDDPRVDIYFSTWDKTTYKNPLIGFWKQEDVTKERIIADLGKDAVIEIESENLIKEKRYNSKMVHRWLRGITLIKNSGIQYDYVVIIRPDIVFDTCIPCSLDTIEDYKDVFGCIWANSLHINKLSDLLFITSYKCMLDVFDKLSVDTWVYSTDQDWHSWWFSFVNSKVTIKNAVELGHVTFCRAWALPTDTFSELVNKQHDWRDLLLLHQLRMWGREFSVKTWSEAIVLDAERKWGAGYFTKYKPKKSVLFLYGRLNHLKPILDNFPLKFITERTSTDIYVHGDCTYQEHIPGLLSVIGMNEPEAIFEIVRNHFNKTPVVKIEDEAFATNTLLMFHRLKYIANKLDSEFYPDNTSIMILRADLCCEFLDENLVTNALTSDLDKFMCQGTNEVFADDQAWILSLKTLKEYLQFCVGNNYVGDTFDTHIALARYFIKAGNFMPLPYNRVIARNNCKDFSTLESVQEAAKVYWDTTTGNEYIRMKFEKK